MLESGERRSANLSGLSLWVPAAVFVVGAIWAAVFVLAPFSGFFLRPWPGGLKVSTVLESSGQEDLVRVGDIITGVGERDADDLINRIFLGPFAGYSSGDTVPLRRLRGEHEAVVLWRMPSRPVAAHLGPVLRTLGLFLAFWFLGTLAIMQLRPRGLPRTLIAGGSFGLALVLVSTLASFSGIAMGVPYACTWLLAAMIVHLHWVVPNPRPPAQRIGVCWLVYSVAGAAAVAELLRWLPPRLYIAPVLLAVAASLGILLIRLLRPRDEAERLAARVMLASLLLGIVPLIAVTLTPILLGTREYTGWVSKLPNFALLIIPLSYTYAAFKHHLGPLELRMNRLLTGFAFAILYSGFALGLLVMKRVFGSDAEALAWALALGLGLVSPLAWSWFRRTTERFVYGVRHRQDEIVPMAASRIARVRTLNELYALLGSEVCPSLLIRESALYLRDDTEMAECVDRQGVETPQVIAIAPVLERAGYLLTAQERWNDEVPWVRLAISLEVGTDSVGVWLLGRRDPDDFYSGHEIRLLQAIGSHAAVAVRNVQLLASERARAAELKAKSAELEQFTYAVSHDLKAPLVTIGGFLGLLERDMAAGDAERVRDDVARIRMAAASMRQHLDALLELSRVGRAVNPIEPLSLRELAMEAVRLVEGAIRERGVEVMIADYFPKVRGDRTRLLQVVQNLVQNAVKFMGDQPSPQIEIGVREGVGDPVFFVKDNGIGIDPQDRERIFTIFLRLSSETEGSGMGLALVQRVIELHGGRIWVESQGRGQGSTFCFTLPLLTLRHA